jgi:uncharacterized membrane protein YdjX (TVP38/TMEM64 family)
MGGTLSIFRYWFLPRKDVACRLLNGDPPALKPSFPWRTLTLALAVAAMIIFPFVCAGARIENWTQDFARGARAHAAPAAWVLGGLLAIDIVAPVPSSLVSTACGLALGFLPGLLVSFAGMTASCALGLALGRWAAPRAGRLLGPRESGRLERWHARWGIWLLAAARPVPVLAEASVLFAGLARLPLRRSAPVLLLSNLGVSAVYAACGAWAASAHGFAWALLAALALPGGALLLAGGRAKARAP